MTYLNTKKNPYLDGWRGSAILLVLGEHFFAPQKEWLGTFGVMLFFVLSGHLMSNLLFIKNVGLIDFFVRRISRIIPTFWLYVLAMIIYASTLQKERYGVPFGEAFSTLAFMRTYLPSGQNIWYAHWPIGNLWSLNVEEHSYVFLAIGALVCRIWNKKFAVGTFLWASTLAAFLLNVYYQSAPPTIGSPWFLRSECAALGLLAAAAMRHTRATISWSRIQTAPPLLPILSYLVALACYSTYAHKGVDRTIAPICLAFSITYIDQVPAIFRSILSAKILQWFGLCSFSLYLWQQPLMMAAHELRMSSMAAFLAALLLGALSFYAFENPIRILINRAWSSRKPALPASSTLAPPPT